MLQLVLVILNLRLSSLSIVLVLLNLFSASTNLSGDVCSTLFGSTSILTLTQSEVWLCIALSVAVVVIFILFYNKIFAVTFDEDFARAAGTRAEAYNLLIAVVTAVIFPAMSAMRIYKSFRAVTICSAVLSVCCALTGILVSIAAGTPVGSTIVAVDIFAFLGCAVIAGIKGGNTK